MGPVQKELKGSTLLGKKQFRFAEQDAFLDDESRRKHCREFLAKGIRKRLPFGWSLAPMVKRAWKWQPASCNCSTLTAALFAAVVPRSIQRPAAPNIEGYLRKDHVFLFERFFYLLEEKQRYGLIVMDETDKTEDRRFVRQMEQYFTKTAPGQYRTTWIIPSPFFVASDMSYAVQAADVCIYCVNWGFRLDAIGMTAASRPEIAQRFGPWLNRLQFHGQGYRDGQRSRVSKLLHVLRYFSAK